MSLVTMVETSIFRVLEKKNYFRTTRLVVKVRVAFKSQGPTVIFTIIQCYILISLMANWLIGWFLTRV